MKINKTSFGDLTEKQKDNLAYKFRNECEKTGVGQEEFRRVLDKVQECYRNEVE